MNELPTTLEGLIRLLNRFYENSTDLDLGTVDLDKLAEQVIALLEQYEFREES